MNFALIYELLDEVLVSLWPQGALCCWSDQQHRAVAPPTRTERFVLLSVIVTRYLTENV